VVRRRIVNRKCEVEYGSDRLQRRVSLASIVFLGFASCSTSIGDGEMQLKLEWRLDGRLSRPKDCIRR
jgi:hypothetical protein